MPLQDCTGTDICAMFGGIGRQVTGNHVRLRENKEGLC